MLDVAVVILAMPTPSPATLLPLTCVLAAYVHALLVEARYTAAVDQRSATLLSLAVTARLRARRSRCAIVYRVLAWLYAALRSIS